MREPRAQNQVLGHHASQLIVPRDYNLLWPACRRDVSGASFEWGCGYSNQDMCGEGGTNVTYYGELSSTRINQSKPLFMCVIDASCAVGFHVLNYWDQRTPPTRKKHRNQFRIVGCSLCCVARILIRGVAQPFMFRLYSNTLTCRVGPNTSTTINYNT
jgi:hypothetical protein